MTLCMYHDSLSTIICPTGSHVGTITFPHVIQETYQKYPKEWGNQKNTSILTQLNVTIITA